jgi:hypothetical protein
MLWKANADHLSVYGLTGKPKPNEKTKLCHAPYLNIYGSGQVCMGTVQINISKTTCLEEFMKTWEQYFFNSNFSHSISGNNSTKTNTTELWRSLAGKGEPFPQNELIKTSLTLKTSSNEKQKIRQPAVHIVQKELLQPYNPVTVNLIGAGGTGGQVLTALGKNEPCAERFRPCGFVRQGI